MGGVKPSSLTVTGNLEVGNNVVGNLGGLWLYVKGNVDILGSVIGRFLLGEHK